MIFPPTSRHDNVQHPVATGNKKDTDPHRTMLNLMFNPKSLDMTSHEGPRNPLNPAERPLRPH